MFRQVGIGAAAVLTIGLLAAGCSEDGDTIISGGGALLNNQDTTPFSGLTSNNLAPDGGGFSPNGASVNAFKITFNCDCAKSDGTFAGDNSAMVLFETTNANSNRVFASYFSGGSFTPPVELEAADRNYKKSVNGLAGYICMPLNTADYQSGNATPASQVNTVRQNNGNWVIIGDFVTQFALPNQNINGTGVGKGVRRTIASWVFLKGEAGNSLSTSTAVGGITREFRYGFQRSGDEIATSHVTGAITGGTGLAPANNVMSYGIASDGLCGQAAWGVLSNKVTPNTGTQAGPNRGISGAGVDLEGAANDTLTNEYTVGESVSSLTVLFTQIETTLSSDGNRLQRNAQDSTTQRGEGLFLRYRNFNLADMTWGTEARLESGSSKIVTNGETEAGRGVFGDFMTYNNTVFFRYMDSSMQGQTGTTGFNSNLLIIEAQQNILAAARFTDQATGVASFDGAVDVSSDSFCRTSANAAGAAGQHNTTVLSVASANLPRPSREDSTFFAYDGDSDSQSIYGADEGLGDLTLFYGIADNTNTGGGTGSGPNIDRELAAVAVPSTGTLNQAAFTTAAFGTNPIRISGDHSSDGITFTTSDPNLTDPIGTPKFAMNRTGEWIGIAFTRNNGVNNNFAFQKDLYANIYQTFRIVASTTQAGATGAVPATMQNRFSGVTVVDTAGSTNDVNNAATNGSELPVNAFAWQGKACYRGWQSDKDVMSLFFEQSDGTGDRVWGAQLTVAIGGNSAAPTAPTLTRSAAVELSNFGSQVAGDASFFTSAGAPGTTTFNFLEGNGRVTSSANFASCDSGLDSNGNAGSVYVTFTRVDDATNTDSGANDFGDVSVYATVFTGSAFEAPVKIGTTADTNETIGAISGGSINSGFTREIATDTNIALLSVDCLPNNTDIANRPSYPSTGDKIQIVTTFKDRDGSTLTTASGATPTVVPGNATGLLVPMFRVLRTTDANATPALTTVDTRMKPSVVNTTASPFVMPVRLAHEAGLTTDVGLLATCQNGTTLHFLFEINEQLWYQVTTGDSAEVLREGSSQQVNPGLVTNFSSADVETNPAPSVECCTNANGDVTGAIAGAAKNDAAGTTKRLLIVDAQF